VSRPSPIHGSPLRTVGAALLVWLACVGWQAWRMDAGTRPVQATTGHGLDAGVPLPPDRDDDAAEVVHTQALASRSLTAGMLAPEEGTPHIPACAVPPTDVVADDACFEGAPYPLCRWRLPEPHHAGHAHTRWRNTRSEHWWGRPGLVSTVLATAHGYADKFPGERLVVGDLDAVGPRHVTHDRGVDVDLYLPGVMESENAGGGVHPSNYVDRPHFTTRMRRARVQALARLLASCTEGAVRIYYNDPEVIRPFMAWFRQVGFAAPFGRPMQAHNDLHRFHFHVTIEESLAPLPDLTPVRKDARPSPRGPTARSDAPARPPRPASPRPATIQPR
jgi:hypothetical protein